MGVVSSRRALFHDMPLNTESSETDQGPAPPLSARQHLAGGT